MTVAEKPIRVLPRFLYVEPISACNLHCRMCYSNILNGESRRVTPADQVLDLVNRFVAATEPPASVYWCGTGEVFLHPDFTRMVNLLAAEWGDALEQTIQTNGTVKHLHEIRDFSRLDFQVSIDGLKPFHEWHRGANTYDRILGFCREALDRGCRALTVRTLLTRDNITSLDEFRQELSDRLGPDVGLTLIAPFNNQRLRAVRAVAPSVAQTDIDDERVLSEEESRAILRDRYQGRYQLEEDAPTVNNYLALNTYGVFSCCTGVIKLGDAGTDVATLRARMAASEEECRSCGLFPCM